MTTKRQKIKKVSVMLSAVLLAAFAFRVASSASLGTSLAKRGVLAPSSEITDKVLLHNDMIDGGTRHVYVENGSIHTVMVRARLREYFQTGNQALVGVSAEDLDTWQPHIFGACTQECHAFFTLSMSGKAKNYLRGVNSNTDSYEDAQRESLISGFQVAQTLPASPVIPMTTYISQIETYSDEGTHACWVADADGWYYWSKPLSSGEATNLLVDEVLLEGRIPDENHYFAFHAEFEAQIIENMDGMYEDLSDSAMILTAAAIHDIQDQERPSVPPPDLPELFTSYDVSLEALTGRNSAAEP